MRRAALICCLLLASCGASPLNLLTGGGPKVAANVQAGKTNTQTLGQTTANDQRVDHVTTGSLTQSGTTTNSVRADRVRHIIVNNTPWWAMTPMGWLATLFSGLIGWLHLPSRKEMSRWLSIKLGWRKAGT